jgi:DNA polymerase I
LEVKLDDFRSIWLVEFESDQPPGERPHPRGLTAREYRSGRHLRLEQENLSASEPPYPVGPATLVVAYDAPAALGCHLALGWPLPERILDLHAEFRCLNSGLEVLGGYELRGALAHFGLEEGPDALASLLAAMQPHIDWPRALLRGWYTAAVAQMEWNGVPIDTEAFEQLREGWGRIQDALIEQVDGMYGVFRGRDFNPRLWAAWLNRNGIPWPRLAPGRLDLTLDTFKKMADAFPEVRPMHELRASLSWLRPLRLSVGSDGRNRCPLRPFASKTGRNQPSTSWFIFGPATWLRGLIKPGEGMALAYIDYEQQEFGIAAALSGDPAMQEAYRSGDPYLAFAKQAGVVPRNATKQTHGQERERFKQCALGVQYGMGAKSLAVRLRGSVDQGRDLLQLHRRTYPRYWRWSNEVERRAHADGKLQAAFGWTVHVEKNANPRSLRNFPLQANGAEMLRLACCFLTEAGVCVCAPVHDALLVEAPVDDIDQVVGACEQEMQRASELVLGGFPLRTDVKVVRFPDRYMDPRGEAMWATVFGLLEREGIARCA